MNVNRKIYNELRKRNARFQEQNTRLKKDIHVQIKNMSLLTLLKIKYLNK